MDQQFGEVARLGWTTRCIDKMWMNVLKVEHKVACSHRMLIVIGIRMDNV